MTPQPNWSAVGSDDPVGVGPSDAEIEACAVREVTVGDDRRLAEPRHQTRVALAPSLDAADPVIFPTLKTGKIGFSQASEVLAPPGVARRTGWDASRGHRCHAQVLDRTS